LRQKSHHFGISSSEKPLYGTTKRSAIGLPVEQQSVPRARHRSSTLRRSTAGWLQASIAQIFDDFLDHGELTKKDVLDSGQGEARTIRRRTACVGICTPDGKRSTMVA
jgi:hypothetical protein